MKRNETEQEKKLRAPIISVLGHIDHGKTSILDYIRGTVVQKHESAGITQHIGASFLPIEDVIQFCGPVGEKMREKIQIPGLLVVDTPGHAAFINLRKRGGAVADIAILVIEIAAGPQPITWESVRILRERKVPFIIAANKLDKLKGWKSKKNVLFFKQALVNQSKYLIQELDDFIYQLMEDFTSEGFKMVDRFDRINDFTKSIAIVPTSAITGEGIPDLMLVLIGLVQQYLKKNIQYSDGPAKGVVLEVKNTQGLGTTLDSIIYDGYIKKGDTIIIGGINGVIETKVKALLQPRPMDEIRDPRYKFISKDIIHASAGIKIAGQNLEGVIAGAPFQVVWDDEQKEDVINTIQAEMSEIRIEVEDQGVILKADSIGSLEAIVKLFKENNIKIRRADIGNIYKKDVIDAATNLKKNPLLSVVLGFNVKITDEAIEEANKQGIRIFTNDVIYRLLEEFQEYIEARKEEEKMTVLSALIKPAIFKIIPEFIFRRSDPAVFGVRIEKGTLKPKVQLINQKGNRVGKVHQIQLHNKSVKEATIGEEVAISINNVSIGREIKIEDTLYVAVPESHVRVLRTRFREDLRPDELEALLEYVKIMRQKESAWWGL
ncbi:MAG: translation initiation factor IF-2 [Promethearchaeota archaeon]